MPRPSCLISVSLLAAAEQDVLPAVFVASAAAAGSVCPPVAVSVAGDAVRLAASGLHLRFVLRVADGPVPAAAEAFVVLYLAACIAFPAVFGTSGPASDCPCLE